MRGQSKSTLNNYISAGSIQVFRQAQYRHFDKLNEGNRRIALFVINFGKLPGRFVKIRRYAIYNHTTKRNLGLQFVESKIPDIDDLIKQKLPPETRQERLRRLTGVDHCKCLVCKEGNMVKIRELPRMRSPGWMEFAQPFMQK